VFSSKDFTDLGSRESIDTALHRLLAKGVIRRAMWGIYDLSVVSRITGEPVSPDVWSVAQTIARKNGWKIVPSGETALNVLGLSTQVPGTYLFFTDAQSREYRLGNRRLCFRRRTPRDMQSADGTGALVVQALKALGRERVDGAVIECLRRKLTRGECQELLHRAPNTEPTGSTARSRESVREVKMDRVARMSQVERNELFRETASRMGIPESIAEKDFWVCWVLRYLFLYSKRLRMHCEHSSEK
jgi:hypothetical protein